MKTQILKVGFIVLLGLIKVATARADYYGPGALCTAEITASFWLSGKIESIPLTMSDVTCTQVFQGAVVTKTFSGSGGLFTYVINKVTPNGSFGDPAGDISPIGANANVRDLSSAVKQRDLCYVENYQNYFGLMACNNHYLVQVSAILYATQNSAD